jgi:arginine exporter protein ArgO
VLTIGIGGLLGLILVSAVLDWALIALSSLAGASLVTEALNFHNVLAFMVFVVLIAIGVSFQARELRINRHKSN